MDLPETRFARLGDQQIAYQVFGEGDLDIVIVSGWFSNVDGIWDEPTAARFLRRLGGFSRVILFDRRGTGASDPSQSTTSTTLEGWADDVRVVMDAAGSRRAALLALVDGGRMAMLFAASFPDRTSGLILINSAARFLRSDDYPCGVPEPATQRLLDTIGSEWGKGAIIDFWAPTHADDPDFQRWWARYQRMSASPSMGQSALRTAIGIDVRHVLPAIRVPTLVLQRAENPLVSVEHGKYLAEHIPDAAYVELPGVDFFPWTVHANEALGEIEEFLTGVRSDVEIDRMLATIMFTDIVSSTEQLARLGDRRWAEQLDAHHRIVRSQLRAYDGNEINTVGDGFLATFNGPVRAIRCACAIRHDVQSLGLEIRAGLHTGEVQLQGRHDVAGMSVHVGARVAAKAGRSEVLISKDLADLIAGSDIELADRGVHELKGVPGDWQLFAVDA
jgi:pimeloyl-ACP methyl ester carboxylesterase